MEIKCQAVTASARWRGGQPNSLLDFHTGSTQESSTDDVLGLSLGTGVDLPVVTFRDDDDPAVVLRAQRKARNRAPFVVLRMPSLVEEDSIEAGDDLSTRMRKKAAARLRKKGTRSLSPFPSQREKEAVVAVKLAAFATRREVSDERTSLTRAATSPTWGSEALRRDLESRTWRVYARVGEVRGARCSVPIVIKSQVVARGVRSHFIVRWPRLMLKYASRAGAGSRGQDFF